MCTSEKQCNIHLLCPVLVSQYPSLVMGILLYDYCHGNACTLQSLKRHISTTAGFVNCSHKHSLRLQYNIECVGGINYTISFFSNRNKEFQQMCCGSDKTVCTSLFSVKNNSCSWVCGPL